MVEGELIAEGIISSIDSNIGAQGGAIAKGNFIYHPNKLDTFDVIVAPGAHEVGDKVHWYANVSHISPYQVVIFGEKYMTSLGVVLDNNKYYEVHTCQIYDEKFNIVGGFE